MSPIPRINQLNEQGDTRFKTIANMILIGMAAGGGVAASFVHSIWAMVLVVLASGVMAMALIVAVAYAR